MARTGQLPESLEVDGVDARRRLDFDADQRPVIGFRDDVDFVPILVAVMMQNARPIRNITPSNPDSSSVGWISLGSIHPTAAGKSLAHPL